VRFGSAEKDRVECTLGVYALSGGFAGMMPRANAAQVGKGMVVPGDNVIYFGCLIAAPLTVLFQDFAPTTAPLKYGLTEDRPVGGQPRFAITGCPCHLLGAVMGDDVFHGVGLEPCELQTVGSKDDRSGCEAACLEVLDSLGVLKQVLFFELDACLRELTLHGVTLRAGLL